MLIRGRFMKSGFSRAGLWLAGAISFALSSTAALQAQGADAEIIDAVEAQVESQPAAAPDSSETVNPPPLIPTENFAGRSAFWGAQISPDGSMFSFLRKRDGETEFVVVDVATKKVVTAFRTQKDDQLGWYRWAANDKMLLSVSTMGKFQGAEVRFKRLMLVQPKAGTLDYLFGKTSVVETDNVIHTAEDGSYILVALQRSIYDYPSVVRHELVPDGDVTTVQKPKEGVWNWVADDAGVVRMGTSYKNKRLRIYYRPDADSPLKLVAKIKDSDQDDKYWDALAIVSGSDTGYVLSEGDNGRVGLRRFNYATREELDTVYEHPDWDIESVTLKDGKPYAAFYTADRDEVHWFDDARRKQYADLKKALGDVEVWVTSRAKDESRQLVWAGSEADPGVLYLFEPAAGRMEQIAEYRPNLDFRLLAKPKPVSYTARDGTPIPSYLTLPKGREAKNLPLIILPHGGPYGVRDKLQYNDEVQLLANRGYAVLQPNFRGSGGYGEAFFELGTGEIGRKMQDDLDDAMDWAVNEGIADKSRVCVVGSSYGGYAAMWAVLRNPERYRCAASWAGVTDLDRQLKFDRRSFSSGSNFKRWRSRVRGEDQEHMKNVSPYRTAATLNRPLLLAHGTKDVVVPFRQYTQFEKAARKAPVKPTTLVIKDEGHGFSSAKNEKAWYDALEAFLQKHNPPGPLAAAAE